jgi:trk system potassium uptake protein TrkH
LNIRIVLYLLGKLCTFLGAFYAVPLLVAVYYGDQGREVFPACIVLCVLLGLLFTKYGHFNRYSELISNRDGILVTVFVWILAAVLSAVPYAVLGYLDPVSAYFEAMSGLTTVGATVISDVEAWPKSLLFWRFWTHWLGGLGIIVIFLAILPTISGSAVHLFNAESTGFEEGKLKPKLKNTAQILFGIYLGLTVAAAVLLLLAGLSPYDAVCHAMTCVATGGFSNYNSSVAHFQNPLAELILGVTMFLAGGNFSLYYNVLRKGPKTILQDDEFRAYATVFFLVGTLITLNLFGSGFDSSLIHSFRVAFYQTASFASTTGTVSTDFEQWPAFSKLLLCLLYITGGCAGSTAGGVKMSRMVVLFRGLRVDILHMLHPKTIRRVHYNGRVISRQTMHMILSFFTIYIFTVTVTALVIAATGTDVLTALTASASCISSAGPGFGAIIGATGTYAPLPLAAKFMLTWNMVMGRLELFVVLALLNRGFWRGNSKW